MKAALDVVGPWLFVAAIVGILVWMLYMLHRNSRVFAFRMALLDRVSAESLRRIDAGRLHEWSHLYRVLDDVSYEAMVKGFKPLEDYFAGSELEADAILAAQSIR